MKIKHFSCLVMLLSLISTLNGMDEPLVSSSTDNLQAEALLPAVSSADNQVYIEEGRRDAAGILQSLKARFQRAHGEDQDHASPKLDLLTSLQDILDTTSPASEMHKTSLTQYRAYWQAFYEHLMQSNLDKEFNTAQSTDQQLIAQIKQVLQRLISFARTCFEEKAWDALKLNMRLRLLDGWDEKGTQTALEVLHYVKTNVLEFNTATLEKAIHDCQEKQTQPTRFLEGILDATQPTNEIHKKAFAEYKAYWQGFYAYLTQNNLEEALNPHNKHDKNNVKIVKLNLRANAVLCKIKYVNAKSWNDVKLRRRMDFPNPYERHGRQIAFAMLDCLEASFLHEIINMEDAERYLQIAPTLPLSLISDVLEESSPNSELHKNAFGDYLAFWRTIYECFTNSTFTAGTEQNRIALKNYTQTKALLFESMMRSKNWEEAKARNQAVTPKDVAQEELDKYSELTRKGRTVPNRVFRSTCRHNAHGLDADDFRTSEYGIESMFELKSIRKVLTYNIAGLKADRRLSGAERQKMEQNEDYKKGFDAGLIQVARIRQLSHGIYIKQDQSGTANTFQNMVAYCALNHEARNAFEKVRNFANGMRCALEKSDLRQVLAGDEASLVRRLYDNLLKKMEIFSYEFSFKGAQLMDMRLSLCADDQA